MKIEIDLNDIMGDPDYGAETLNESIRRQVIDNVTRTIKEGIGKRVDAEVGTLINEEIKTLIASQMPGLLSGLMETEYTIVGTYGSRGETTTVREQLVKMVTAQMTYVPKNYNSEKNAFTSAVDALVSSKVGEFKANFDKQVDSKFIAEAMDYATKKLADRLKVAA